MFVARPEARDAASAADSWRRIGAWLGEHAPDLHARLRPGATAAELDAFGTRFGLRLPASVRESYLVHDGEDGPLGFGVLLGNPYDPLDEAAYGLAFNRAECAAGAAADIDSSFDDLVAELEPVVGRAGRVHLVLAGGRWLVDVCDEDRPGGGFARKSVLFGQR